MLEPLSFLGSLTLGDTLSIDSPQHWFVAFQAIRIVSERNRESALRGIRLTTMARKDQLTGKGPMSGNHVSHAHNKVRRRFNVNLQKKRFYIPEEDRWVTLRVSTQTLKTINKKGISAVLKDARANGVSI